MHDGKFIDLSGKQFNNWTVLSSSHKNGDNWYWNCKCSCGKEKIILGSNIRNGKSTGCGHNRKTNKTHGMSGTRPWMIHNSMKQRCFNEKVPAYKDYGGRGIKVCKEWIKFEGFWNDMKNGYRDDLTLDRIDVNGNYCKENCRWSNMLEQNNNTRVNKILELNGTRDTLPNWARKLGINQKTLSSRVYLYKWDDKKSLTTPLNVYKSSKFRNLHKIP